MKIDTILSPDELFIGLKADSKKHAFQGIIRLLAPKLQSFDQRRILDQLIEREQLGSTGLGEGIAIPHTRFEFPKDADLKPITCLTILESPIEYNAHDDLPVDIIFMLFAPENISGEHLMTLALASRILRNRTCTTKLRTTKTADEAWSILNDETIHNAA